MNSPSKFGFLRLSHNDMYKLLLTLKTVGSESTATLAMFISLHPLRSMLKAAPFILRIGLRSLPLKDAFGCVSTHTSNLPRLMKTTVFRIQEISSRIVGGGAITFMFTEERKLWLRGGG